MVKRKRKKLEISPGIKRFIEERFVLTPEDLVKLGMLIPATYMLKELKLIHWEPLWRRPTPRQETLNWMTNAVAAYLLIYKPEAIAALIRPFLKLPVFM